MYASSGKSAKNRPPGGAGVSSMFSAMFGGLNVPGLASRIDATSKAILPRQLFATRAWEVELWLAQPQSWQLPANRRAAAMGKQRRGLTSALLALRAGL